MSLTAEAETKLEAFAAALPSVELAGVAGSVLAAVAGAVAGAVAAGDFTADEVEASLGGALVDSMLAIRASAALRQLEAAADAEARQRAAEIQAARDRAEAAARRRDGLPADQG